MHTLLTVKQRNHTEILAQRLWHSLQSTQTSHYKSSIWYLVLFSIHMDRK